MLLVVHLYTNKSKKKISMVQKSSVKKDALLPCYQKGRVGGCVRVFMPSPQSPPPLPQIPEEERKESHDEGVSKPSPQVGSHGDWI